MGEGEEVKLHGVWASAFTRRAIWALKLKGIAYEFIEEDLSNKSPQLLQHNPVYSKVPVLVHGGKPVSESMIIVEYIDEAWRRSTHCFLPILITDPRLASGFNLLNISIEGRDKSIKETLELLEVAETQCLGEKKFFGGENINIVDIAFGAIIHWLQVIEEVLDLKLLQAEKFPHLYSWINNFRDAPVIKDNLPDAEKMLAYFKVCYDIPTSLTLWPCGHSIRGHCPLVASRIKLSPALAFMDEQFQGYMSQ
ncbi:hypothetical protein L6164_013119 [Bauhinia variegata]|uniref:Uncharacterized protein n=1 Tax=Bauhinia variegata TaxID=167791 RepID=A0ACB9PDB6_BAUVA|nr:hypothetical protein L6164_013119 [Bauhinia variegata]